MVWPRAKGLGGCGEWEGEGSLAFQAVRGWRSKTGAGQKAAGPCEEFWRKGESCEEGQSSCWRHIGDCGCCGSVLCEQVLDYARNHKSCKCRRRISAGARVPTDCAFGRECRPAGLQRQGGPAGFLGDLVRSLPD